MMTVQRAIIDLLRIRIEQLDAEQSCDIPPFLILTAEERRRAWTEFNGVQTDGRQ